MIATSATIDCPVAKSARNTVRRPSLTWPPTGQRTARTELGQERPLDLDRMTRVSMVDAGHRSERVHVVDPTLDGHTSLADGRHERRDVEAPLNRGHFVKPMP